MSADVIEFYGEEYALPDKIGLMPLMRFAKLAPEMDSNTMEGLAALYDLLRQCLDEEDWQRFEAAADKHRADADDIMSVVRRAIEIMSARPTSRPSASSDGPPSTSGSSTAGSSSPVVRRYEQRGRPDLALVIQEAETAQGVRAS